MAPAASSRAASRCRRVVASSPSTLASCLLASLASSLCVLELCNSDSNLSTFPRRNHSSSLCRAAAADNPCCRVAADADASADESTQRGELVLLRLKGSGAAAADSREEAASTSADSTLCSNVMT
eukprot:CAMPEP_0175893974 /NCGR_PEP_ID=MMETSP0107_2-20121207/49748_1 /TAXON_ID=195067 ORGANISM="Goniomonas pacifica, Strain CCMP1869" /NCGR_SAMPLE_ID=MMETSP0107_2 /ASSEMBLY_ACC=CAM_ASM_000203 /LENGTH=124 /DNA_ID=CAMNT_0017215043 /DNA_START=73 /DNA_END=444 /DNA_ORIENTATION=-